VFDGPSDVRYKRVPMSPSAYPSPSLVDRIAEQVTTQIYDGALRAGDTVNIDALARAAQVSSVPVREALARLGATGLLVFTPNRGYSVAPLLTLEQRAALFEARAVIEVAAVPFVVARHKPAQLNVLEGVNLRIRRLATVNPPDGQRQFFRLNNDFHLAYLAAAHNDYLSKLFASLAFDMLLMREDDDRDIPYAQLADEHDAIIAAIRAGDVGTLGAMMRSHIANAI
jgi:DNA-binding GntR family transcriptional regulator